MIMVSACLAEADASELHIQQVVLHRYSKLFVLEPLFPSFIQVTNVQTPLLDEEHLMC